MPPNPPSKRRLLCSIRQKLSGLEIYDGHVAIAVDAPCLCCNAPRNLHDLRPQMACPFFKECRRTFNSYFEKQALKIFSFIAGMNWKVINVYQGDNQIKKTKTKPVCRDRLVSNSERARVLHFLTSRVWQPHLDGIVF